MGATDNLAKAMPGSWRGEQFGEWHVARQTDEMSPTTIVTVGTIAELLSEDGEPTGLFHRFGFQFFGPDLITLESTVLGHNYWPECDYALSSISVDGGRASYIADVDQAGLCNSIAFNGATTTRMRAGQSAKVRIRGQDMRIPLAGFTSAMRRARQIASN